MTAESDEIERLRRALQTIVDWCPATQEITLAHQMAEVAENALAHSKETDDQRLARIEAWCEAYPIKAFPEPDMAKAARLLEAGGMTLAAVSASNMRHVLDGIRKIIREDEEMWK